MDGRFVGRRGEREDEWSWESKPGRQGRAGRWNLHPLIVAVAVLLVAGVAGVLLAIADGSGDDKPESSTVPVPGSPSPRRSPSPAPATASPSPTSSPEASPAPALSLSWWDPAEHRWREDAISGASGYREGDTVPFLVRVDNAREGVEYTISINYSRCGDSPGASFDFLADARTAGDEASLAAGRGSERPDATIGIPDDPTTETDDAASGRLLRLWGATFGETPEGPVEDCGGGRSIRVKVLARSGNVMMMWGSHLASAADWPGAGAAGRSTPFYARVQASPAGEAVVQVSPGAIAP